MKPEAVGGCCVIHHFRLASGFTAPGSPHDTPGRISEAIAAGLYPRISAPPGDWHRRNGGGVRGMGRAVEPNRGHQVAALNRVDRATGKRAVPAGSPGGARLRHPNIVQPYQFGEVDNAAYLVMEYVDGPNLHATVAGQQVAPELAAEIVRTVAAAVGYAHRAGVVHRDVKPANILLVSPDLSTDLRVTDFGMARLVEDDAAVSRDGTVAGTPGYMAPEQCVANGVVGPWTDVYALGVILYELLTGRLPITTDPPELYAATVQKTPPLRPRLFVPGIPADLESVCLKCLAKKPGDRYLTADDLADDLARFAAKLPVRARPATLTRTVLMATRRNPIRAMLFATTLGSIIASTAISTWLWREAEHQRSFAVTQSENALAAHRAAETARLEALQAAAAEVAARKVAEKARADMQAINQFVVGEILGGDRGHAQRPGRDATVTDALLVAAPKISGKFPDNPVIVAELELLIANSLVARTEYAAAVGHWARASVAAAAVHGPNSYQALYCQLQGAVSAIHAGDPVRLDEIAATMAALPPATEPRFLDLRLMLAHTGAMIKCDAVVLSVMEDGVKASILRYGENSGATKKLTTALKSRQKRFAQAAVAGGWQMPLMGKAITLKDR